MSEESQLGASGDGTVMLDIGGDIGALIIMTPAEMHRVEIELSPVDDHDGDNAWSHSLLPHEHGDHAHTHHRPGSTHVAVRERTGPSGVRYAAIFPGLVAGEYTVWDVDGSVKRTVTITGGEVLSTSWDE